MVVDITIGVASFTLCLYDTVDSSSTTVNSEAGTSTRTETATTYVDDRTQLQCISLFPVVNSTFFDDSVVKDVYRERT